MNLEILYLDNHLLVVNKPAGLLAQRDETGDADVVSIGKQYLKERFDKPGRVYLGLVHRLDRPASGVMVLARTSKAAARLSEQFRERTPTRTYVALVEGHIRDDGARLVDYLLKEDRRVRVVDSDHQGARRTELSYEVGSRKSWRNHHASLVEVRLMTGRAHQIRAQMASHGYPLVGDLRYGAELEFDGRNLALHACALTIEHPTRRESMTFKAPPAATWGDDFSGDVARIMSRL